MEKLKYLIFGLSSFILLLNSCNQNKDEEFYNKIRSYNRCIIPCEFQYEKHVILIVSNKDDLLRLLETNGLDIDEEKLITYLKQQMPIKISKNMFNNLYGIQILPQANVDSLCNLGIDRLLSTDSNGNRYLDVKINNSNGMTNYYAIKKLFDKRILLQWLHRWRVFEIKKPLPIELRENKNSDAILD